MDTRETSGVFGLQIHLRAEALLGAPPRPGSPGAALGLWVTPGMWRSFHSEPLHCQGQEKRTGSPTLPRKLFVPKS